MMNAPADPAEQRDWQALPAGVLQHIFYLASCSQTPGTCVAAPVCHSWRSAAAGCNRLWLLYHAGYQPADESFAIWLERNGGQLGALIISSSDEDAKIPAPKPVLTALEWAAAAAQAAGRPLQLHTLRVLGYATNLRTAGRLLAALPRLRCLQLQDGAGLFSAYHGRDVFLEALAPLQQATQLEELYIEGLFGDSSNAPRAALLPPSLKRLSWGYDFSADQDLSHLTQCTFLRLSSCRGLRSNQLPPRLQQLELQGAAVDLEVVEEHKEVVTSWGGFDLGSEGVQQLLPRLPKLAAVTLGAHQLQNAAALKQASQVSMLTVYAGDVFAFLKPPHDQLRKMQAAVAVAAGFGNLRRLELLAQFLPERPLGLPALKQLTQLRLSIRRTDSVEPQHCSWVQEVSSLQRLQWLSLPNVFLHEQQDWLGQLQQLRVLVLKCTGAYLLASSHGSDPWLKGFVQQALPQSLRVLGLYGMTAEQAAAWQLRRHMQQRLASSGCEVVVGLDLHEVCDPVQQLAGVPVALQQVLSCQA